MLGLYHPILDFWDHRLEIRIGCVFVGPTIGAQPRAAREPAFDLAFFRARLDGCSALLGSLSLEARRYERSAWFTRLPLEKAFATSGSSKTMVVPAVARARYFPRTPPLNERRSYSCRSSSANLLSGLLVGMCFTLGCRPRTHDSDMVLAAISVGHKQNALFVRGADCNEPILLKRMVRVVEGQRERVCEHRGRLVEADLVPLEVRRRFLRIPFVDHISILRLSARQVIAHCGDD